MPFLRLFRLKRSRRSSEPSSSSTGNDSSERKSLGYPSKSKSFDKSLRDYDSATELWQPDAPPDYSKYDIDDSDLAGLSKYDTIFVVDDSTSMTSVMASDRTRWEEACDALADFATLAAKYDNDGIDIHFFNSPKSSIGLQSRASIEALFRETSPKGGTYIGKILHQLSGSYISKLATAAASNRPVWPKPRSYIIITDGKSRDEEVLRRFIQTTAKTLHTLKCPPGQLGFQFFQIGNNAAATKFLEELDGDRRWLPEDIVDTIRSAGPDQSFCTDFAKKVLLGGINRRFDRSCIRPSRKRY